MTGQRSRYRPTRLLGAATVLAALAAGGCGRNESELAAFCVQFPQRDAGVALRVANDPAIRGDTAVARQLLAFSAEGVDKHAPQAIASAVTTYVGALRGYQPGTDPLADPAVARAVDDINRWLLANCPAPTGTTPASPPR